MPPNCARSTDRSKSFITNVWWKALPGSSAFRFRFLTAFVGLQKGEPFAPGCLFRGLERLLAKDSASDCGSSSSSFLIASCKAPESKSLAVFLILSAVAIFSGELLRLRSAILIYQSINCLWMHVGWVQQNPSEHC